MGNIAINKSATASSSVLPYTATNAVNGATTPLSRWLCNTLPGWMKVDLGTPYLVNQWVIKHMPVAGWPANYANTDFKLQGSNDNTNWFDIDPVTGNTASITSRTINPTSARYFRVYFSKGLNTNNQMASVVEFELYQAYSAQLTNLVIGSGALTPAFNTTTLAYTASVTSGVSSVNVMPAALSPTAVIKVNNNAVISGQPSLVNLAFGSNTIIVNVTDGAVIQNYTITVVRPGSFLTALTVQSGVTSTALVPTFVKTTLNYTASVAANIATVSFTPTAETAGSTITINNVTVVSGQQSTQFNLVTGNNTFNIVVTANGISTPYTVIIAKAGNLILNQTIVTYSGRSISTGSKTVGMNQTDLVYNTTVPTGSQTITVTPSAQNSAAIIKVNNNIVVSGSPSSSITLNTAGTTTVAIVLSSQDGSSSSNYTLNITIG